MLKAAFGHYGEAAGVAAAQKMRNKALEDMAAQHAFHTQIDALMPVPVANPNFRKVYIIGSLRNPQVALQAALLRKLLGPEVTVFDDWLCAGPHADDAWRDHEKSRGNSFIEALKEPAAKHVFDFDKQHLTESDAVVLIAPAGKSAHLELGWSLGRGTPGFILLDSPDRWDVMYQFASAVTDDVAELANLLQGALYSADNP